MKQDLRYLLLTVAVGARVSLVEGSTVHVGGSISVPVMLRKSIDARFSGTVPDNELNWTSSSVRNPKFVGRVPVRKLVPNFRLRQASNLIR